MAKQTSSGDFENPTPAVFPRWANFVVPGLLVAIFGGLPYMLVLIGFGAAPSTTDVGYRPHQPIPYSHQLHVTQLGLDCRYCHTTVEKASFAAIPASAVCMNCHHAIRKDSPNLKELYASFKDGLSLKWKKVHDLPDYAYFNHAAHVNKGVSCVSCHGRVDQMDGQGVYQQESLSMGWCLDCHRDPAKNVRPTDQVTNLRWGLNLSDAEIRQLEQQYDIKGLKVGDDLTPEQRTSIGLKVLAAKNIDAHRLQRLQDCSTCHR